MGWWRDMRVKKDEDEQQGMDAAYLSRWKARDAELQANGFPPSKLGPGVPAVTTTSPFGTTYQDDNGDEIPAPGVAAPGGAPESGSGSAWGGGRGFGG